MWRLQFLVLLGCGAATTLPPAPVPAGSVYRSAGSAFERGPLAVVQRDVPQGETGAPRPARVHGPAVAGTYPVVQFQHGFLTDARAYDEVLGHLASHGFVVVAPQMYAADGVPLGKATAVEEARAAAEVARWSREVAPALLGSAAAPGAIGLAGHSRGGKVAWLLAAAKAVPVAALFGVDPVDGHGGPLLSAQPEALPGAMEGLPPSVILGMERGGACAPEGDNYAHFFARTTAPSELFVVQGHGHADLLDPGVDLEGLCFAGPAPEKVRVVTGGYLAAWFRLQLQGDAAVQAELDEPGRAPLEVHREVR